ncbi:MAG: hypothetical protein KBB26_10155 [Candidatus Omnitrophica bacterium]|nr:hypothetical protein [Candidatus Omnitrophota bacterium]
MVFQAYPFQKIDRDNTWQEERAILVIQKEYNLLESVVFAISNAVGSSLALILFSSIREQLELDDIPQGMRGIPITLVIAGLLSLAFMGFAGIVR